MQHDASLEWDKHWDLSGVERIVLGGDGARWTDQGADVLPHCVRQLDGYHLLRECKRGWEKGYDVYDAVRQGEVLVSEERACRLGDFVPREGKSA